MFEFRPRTVPGGLELIEFSQKQRMTWSTSRVTQASFHENPKPPALLITFAPRKRFGV